MGVRNGMFTASESHREYIPGPGVKGRIMLSDGRVPLEEYAGGIRCVYIDPPFNTGGTFVMRQKRGEKDWAGGGAGLTLPAYTDRSGSREEYHAFLGALIRSAYALLDGKGVFFLHLDPRESAAARILCDGVFGADHFVNEIVWAYQSGGRTVKRFPAKHDTILFYRKGKQMDFNLKAVPLPREGNRHNHMRRQVDENGRAFRTIRSGGRIYTYYDDDPVYPGDVWTDISHIQQKDPQRTGYDTQKPLKLLERVFLPVTSPGDPVADLCCGSGTAGAAAAALGRPFLLTDISPLAVLTARRRLLRCSLTVDMPALDVGGGILCDCEREGDRERFFLKAYRPEGEEERGTDLADTWAVGELRDGVFTASAVSCRSREQPALLPFLEMPLSPFSAVEITDVYGRRSVWTRRE